MIALVSTQLAQTLVDSQAPLVVLTTVGSLGVLMVVVSTPGVSQVFGCTPVGPLAWGQGLFGTAVATLLSAVAPELLVRFSEIAQRWLEDWSLVSRVEHDALTVRGNNPRS